MKLFNIAISIALIALLYSCNQGTSGDFNTSGYDTEKISGTNAMIVSKKNNEGVLTEQGMVANGYKNGTWLTFNPDGRIRTLQSFVDGKQNGISLTFSSRGQIEKKENILNSKLHGEVTSYKFGSPIKSFTYKNGVFDGPFVEYSDRGKMQKKGSFKDGKQHGTLQFFGDEEKLTMEYEYDMGEKVSGGMIEQ